MTAVLATDLTAEQIHDSEVLLHKYVGLLEQVVAEEKSEGRNPRIPVQPVTMALVRLAGRMISKVPEQHRGTAIATILAALMSEVGAKEVEIIQQNYDS